MLRRAAGLLGLVLMLAVPAAKAEPVGPPVEVEKLLAGRTPVTVTVTDPVYKKTKRFEGYRLAELLRAAWPQVDQWANEGGELVMTASDGYAPSMNLAHALANKGVIAVRDLDQPPGDPWEPFPKGAAMITPAPYYLVWEGVDPADPHFRWPYRLVRLSVEPFQRRYGAAAPPAGAGARAESGYRLFVQNCIACHSLNLIGGTIGPELNVPKNITEYWSANHLAAFIRDPLSYRAHSKMPSFGGLPDGDRAAIIAYLTAMKNRKVCGPGQAKPTC
ncbi:MAG: cytochrome c family protein [Alphaproteobacteria bacterium]